MKKALPILLSLLLMLVLALPLLQSRFGLINEKSLEGYVSEVKMPVPCKEGLFSTNYQSGLELYISRNFGFRASVVRVYNQVQYSLFKKANAYSIVVGRDNYLFAMGYIRALTGENYLGQKRISEKSIKIQKIQRDLESKGKNFIVVIAASKARSLSDKIPDLYLNNTSVSNYETYVERFEDLNINFIDFQHYFDALKEKSTYPLYPKKGIHWSTYGTYIASDSLVKYIEEECKVDLPDILLDTIEIKPAFGPDIDIEKSLNLVFPIRDQKYAYPKLSFDAVGKDSLNVLVIGDSFYFQINGLGIPKHVFGEGSRFWFYYQEVYPNVNGQKVNARDLDFGEQMDNFDLVLLLTQDGTFESFAWDFVEDYNRLIIDDSGPEDADPAI